MGHFRFKQFSVRQEQSAMKVGTDGVLLGAWVQATEPGCILDIGTGTGVIALMLAQRFPSASVHAIEIETTAYEQALENVANAPFGSRLKVFHASLL
jgi:tRNA1Val (adenine37-N6)-methyltransferase